MGKAKGLIAKVSGADKPKEELPKNKEEHDIQVNAGLAAIDTEEQKYLENKEISRENAVKVADTVKKAYPVFKSITVVDGGKTWDYDYVASPGKIKEGLKRQKTYQTYTKTNQRTGEVYAGRTSGTGTPLENIAKRDANHHMNKEGFDKAKLDMSSTNREAIRGREQQLIDEYGGARSQGGSSGNSINGISERNPRRSKYLNEAKKEFGEDD